MIKLKPIGFLKTVERNIPRHWTVSEAEGEIVLDEQYLEGLRDIKPGEKIVVIFHFHKSPPFSKKHLIQKPPHKDQELGVFSTCSPIRPNPIGLSVVEVMEKRGNILKVKGIDMLDGTPILDIKPYIKSL